MEKNNNNDISHHFIPLAHRLLSFDTDLEGEERREREEERGRERGVAT